MRRAQISIDLLFAVTIISLTMLSLMNVALSEKTESESFGVSAQLRVMAIDLRDTMARVYAAGPGMSVVKSSPLPLSDGEWIRITAFQNGTLELKAKVGGRNYLVVERLQVPPGNTSSVLLTPGNSTFRIVAVRLPDGGVGVELKT